MEKPVIIFSAGQLGRAVYEIFHSRDITIYCYLDDRKELHGKEVNEVPVMGNMNDEGFLKYIGKKCEAFVASDDNAERKSLVKMLNERRKVMPVNAIHSHANLSKSVEISHGNFINDAVSVGANATIGNHNIVHAGAVIDYATSLGNFIQIGPGAVIGPEVKIEDEVFIGAGAVVVGGLTLGKRARIGAGSVVVSDVRKGETVFGNPAKKVDV